MQNPAACREVTHSLPSSVAGLDPQNKNRSHLKKVQRRHLLRACQDCRSLALFSHATRSASKEMAPARIEPRSLAELAVNPIPTKPFELPGNPSTRVPPTKAKKAEPLSAEAETPSSNALNVLETLVQNSPGNCAVLDGGLATQLERRGADINDPLWSAKCLLEEPLADLVRQVHLEYYKSGADISISASYQATIQGFAARGFSAEQAEDLLTRSVQLVVEARVQFWEEYQREATNGAPKAVRQKPLVAASVGSYGAYLADGSEYSGDYGPDMTLEKLVEFHSRRVQVLAAAGPDVLAFETIPSLLEAQALVRILEEENLGVPAWISFNSKDGRNVVRGDPFEDCARVADQCKHVVAVGINCTPPRFIKDIILSIRKVSSKLLVVYPNSGESWDGERKEWVPNTVLGAQESTGVSDNDFVSFAPQWVEAGANIMGGCCRTTPHTISCIRHAVHRRPTVEEHVGTDA